ncbi:hypothetical protein ABZV58_32640 [Nocardia sp. NPDC004654]|uniref:hypothetical protein n=1 Tax=Nocardia sp. NPDC004654 TaxID=3154776 RepID=UPI0033BCD0AD
MFDSVGAVFDDARAVSKVPSRVLEGDGSVFDAVGMTFEAADVVRFTRASVTVAFGAV